MQTWSPVVIVLGKWLDLLKVTNSQNEMYEHKYEVLMNFILQKVDDSEIKTYFFSSYANSNYDCCHRDQDACVDCTN